MGLLFVLRWIRRVVVAVVLLVVLAFFITCASVWYVARQDERPRSDAIIVMGASQFNGRPSSVFAARLAHAKTLYDDRVATRIVTVGGGQPGDRFTEAEAGARWLSDRGVPRSALVVLAEGGDTLASLRAADRVYERNRWRSAVLVTDPWHELRSRRMASDLGIDAAVSPARSGPAVRTRATQIRYIAREAAAYLYYRVFHSDATKGPGAL